MQSFHYLFGWVVDTFLGWITYSTRFLICVTFVKLCSIYWIFFKQIYNNHLFVIRESILLLPGNGWTQKFECLTFKGAFHLSELACQTGWFVNGVYRRPDSSSFWKWHIRRVVFAILKQFKRVAYKLSFKFVHSVCRNDRTGRKWMMESALKWMCWLFLSLNEHGSTY